MNKLIEDLSKLTTIPESKIENLTNICNYCISNEVVETLLKESNIVEYDIGIGKLLIKIDNLEIKYKFIPSEKLESSIISCVKTKQNLLCNKIEKTLVDCITNTYKDLF